MTSRLRFSPQKHGTIAAALAAGLLITAAQAGSLPPKVPAPTGAFPFAEYDGLLKKYVDEQGRVDYAGLRKNDAATVEKLYAFVASTGPTKTPDLYKGKDAALAYFLSAYNVLVWKNVLDRSPKQVNEKFYAFFRTPEFQVDGQEVDLDDLEKKVITKRFKDGRVHFALNCASGGCPKLPRDAFTPEKVQAQLDTEARRFTNEKRNVDYDPAAKRVKLSEIFKWYKDDFGGNAIAFINKYRAPDKQIPADAKVEFIDYDWRMNDKSLPDR
jgi:hypothetical protein